MLDHTGLKLIKTPLLSYNDAKEMCSNLYQGRLLVLDSERKEKLYSALMDLSFCKSTGNLLHLYSIHP